MLCRAIRVSTTVKSALSILNGNRFLQRGLKNDLRNRKIYRIRMLVFWLFCRMLLSLLDGKEPK
ncbi:hypothetical protein HMPREF0519_0179 [Lentilactobacillus hilgardii DSM 20176 = ATCC 8290]|uniref:Uncharacterized protein n=1 Tax=Lentilactobacillus hilgardii (strain ATCC 8290 / DSM 20176 / CCUG 30140 / JCM 1155 / KCTC 3500 / NBRC 15886 / NCIMB 8040 / NRRL B-1843 / 9) TaxID=1423757 RepID=C0XG18_LENH9|nr:hypothetical protein HMPREF0519_0179 [Lentilactobacillus hilgardii DSM 20176 = ATCC 8290]